MVQIYMNIYVYIYEYVRVCMYVCVYIYIYGFPGSSVLKNLPVNAGDMGLILG